MRQPAAVDYPLECQKAYQLSSSTPDGEYRSGDFVYTIPLSVCQPGPLIGDDVVVRREHAGALRYDLMRVSAADTRLVLSPLIPADGETAGQTTLEVVIGVYRSVGAKALA